MEDIGFDMGWVDTMRDVMHIIKSVCEKWAESSQEEYQLCLCCPFLYYCESLDVEPREWVVEME